MRLGELKKLIDEIIAQDPSADKSRVFSEIEGVQRSELQDAERLIVNTYLKFGPVQECEEEDEL